jgi:hypothetical protein
MHSFEKGSLTDIEPIVPEVRRKTRPGLQVAVSAKSVLQHEIIRLPRVADSHQQRELPEFVDEDRETVEIQSLLGRPVDQIAQKYLVWAGQRAAAEVSPEERAESGRVGPSTELGGVAASIARGFWVVQKGSSEKSPPFVSGGSQSHK